MNVAHKYLPNYTYNDYVNWEGNWEIIDGIPYAMSPSPTPQHQWIASVLASEFIAAFKKNKCSCKVYQPLDYKLAENTIFNPDLSVVCKPITKKYLDFSPQLVVEILSESTKMKDRNVKFPRYEAEGIPYYIMIDAEKNRVEVYKLINGRYEQQPCNESKPYEFVLDDCRFELLFDNIWE